MKCSVRFALSGSVAVLGLLALAACGGSATTLGNTTAAASNSPAPVATVQQSTPSPVNTLPAGITQEYVDAVFGALESDLATSCENAASSGDFYIQSLAGVAKDGGGTSEAWIGLIKDWLSKNC